MFTPTKLCLSAAKILVPLIAAIALLVAWRADHHARTQLAADLATAKQALAQSDARQHDRDAQLLQTLAALANEKRQVTTPEQIVRELPKQIPLPSPITLQPASQGSSNSSNSAGNCAATQLGINSSPLVNKDDKTVQDSNHASPSQISARDTDQKASPAASATKAILPEEDLKPLYDFALDCQSCQAKLTTTQADLSDEKAKSAVLSRERDEAVRVAKGGSTLRRTIRAAKWFALGALVGAAAAHASH